MYFLIEDESAGFPKPFQSFYVIIVNRFRHMLGTKEIDYYKQRIEMELLFHGLRLDKTVLFLTKFVLT